MRQDTMKRKVGTKRKMVENPEWTKATFSKAQPAVETLPELFGSGVAKSMLTPRGRPKSATARTAISIRLPPETLARWKATGAGWPSRMAKVLDKAI